MSVVSFSRFSTWASNHLVSPFLRCLFAFLSQRFFFANENFLHLKYGRCIFHHTEGRFSCVRFCTVCTGGERGGHEGCVRTSVFVMPGTLDVGVVQEEGMIYGSYLLRASFRTEKRGKPSHQRYVCTLSVRCQVGSPSS